MSQAEELIRKLDQTHENIAALLPRLEPFREREICPGWTIKEILAHLTGWDELVVAFLEAFTRGEQPATPAFRSIDEYNAGTVSARSHLDYPQVHEEWLRTRQRLRQVLLQMPPRMFTQTFLLLMGEPGTIADLLEIFIEHDAEHAAQIADWLQDPARVSTD